MSAPKKWHLYPPKMVKKQRKCRLTFENLAFIFVLLLYCVITWYQVEDLEEYYSALGNHKVKVKAKYCFFV